MPLACLAIAISFLNFNLIYNEKNYLFIDLLMARRLHNNGTGTNGSIAPVCKTTGFAKICSLEQIRCTRRLLIEPIAFLCITHVV
jgi:hypothetical protein